MQLDCSPEEINIKITANERKLIWSFLETIPVNLSSLSYECAKSLMKKIQGALKEKSETYRGY